MWPAAVYEYFVDREPASHWYRTQVRQAVRFGLSWGTIFLIALIWPLVLSLAAVNPTATLVFYAVGMAGDCAVFVLWLRRAFGYSKRARRGETFSIGRYAA